MKLSRLYYFKVNGNQILNIVLYILNAKLSTEKNSCDCSVLWYQYLVAKKYEKRLILNRGWKNYLKYLEYCLKD